MGRWEHTFPRLLFSVRFPDRLARRTAKEHPALPLAFSGPGGGSDGNALQPAIGRRRTTLWHTALRAGPHIVGPVGMVLGAGDPGFWHEAPQVQQADPFLCQRGCPAFLYPASPCAVVRRLLRRAMGCSCRAEVSHH